MSGLLLRLLRSRWSWSGIARAVGRSVAAHELVIGAVGLVVVGMVVVLVAWELPRRHVVRVARRVTLSPGFTRAARHAGVMGREDSGVSVRKVQATPAGHRLKVELPPGTHAGTLEDAREAIAATLGVREVRVARDAANAGVVWVNVVRTDTLASPTPLAWGWVAVERTSFAEPIPLGVDEDGVAVRVGMLYRNILVAGEPGGGKSVAVNLLTAAAALDPSVSLTLLDGKLVELAVWRRCAEACVGVSVADAIDVLGMRQADMNERYRFMADTGARKISPGDGFGLSVIVIDELAHYCATDDSKAAKEFAGRARDLVSRGRAAGVVVIAATQKPSFRHHPDLPAGPVRLPARLPVLHPAGLRHHPRPGLGLAGLLGGPDRRRHPGGGLPAARGRHASAHALRLPVRLRAGRPGRPGGGAALGTGG